MLVAQVAKRLNGFELDVALAVDPATTMVVVGESGSGKTTLLRLLAGILLPDQGRITLNGTVYFDRKDHVAVPAWERDIGYVPQDYALFPHLSVFENVAFGLRARGMANRQVRQRVAVVIAQLAIGDLARRRPGALSGGQQQRVALARALVLEPQLLLLDEPLSALDLKTRRTVRGELVRLLASLPCITVYVTHSPIEALLLGDHLTVVEGGRVTQAGSRDDLLLKPRSSYVADIMGVNLMRGTIAAREGGLARVQTPDGTVTVVDPGGDEGDREVFVAVTPREITLYLDPPAASAQNVFRGPIVELVPEPPSGDRLRVVLGTHPPLVAEVTKSAVQALGLSVGRPVYAAFKATGVMTYR